MKRSRRQIKKILKRAVSYDPLLCVTWCAYWPRKAVTDLERVSVGLPLTIKTGEK